MQVLNAKPENVERESEIVAQSGRRGAVTIATNMAGRGTDILLGGNPGELMGGQDTGVTCVSMRGWGGERCDGMRSWQLLLLPHILGVRWFQQPQ